MNNLILALGIFGTAGILCLTQSRAVLHARAVKEAVSSQLNTAGEELNQLKTDTAQVQSRLAARHEELAAARVDLARNAEEARALHPAEGDPAVEGTWPASRPYFYLAKKHLGQVGYVVLSPDRHLSEEAATLFGMSAAERAASLRHTDRRSVERQQPVVHARRRQRDDGQPLREAAKARGLPRDIVHLVSGKVGWRDEGGLVHSCAYEAVWVDCGQSVLAMVDTADEVPVTCLFCVVGYDPIKDLHVRLAAALQLPVEFLGLR